MDSELRVSVGKDNPLKVGVVDGRIINTIVESIRGGKLRGKMVRQEGNVLRRLGTFFETTEGNELGISVVVAEAFQTDFEVGSTVAKASGRNR